MKPMKIKMDPAKATAIPGVNHPDVEDPGGAGIDGVAWGFQTGACAPPWKLRMAPHLAHCSASGEFEVPQLGQAITATYRTPGSVYFTPSESGTEPRRHARSK
jgi:hypothetical protein